MYSTVYALLPLNYCFLIISLIYSSLSLRFSRKSEIVKCQKVSSIQCGTYVSKNQLIWYYLLDLKNQIYK